MSYVKHDVNHIVFSMMAVTLTLKPMDVTIGVWASGGGLEFLKRINLRPGT